MDGSALERLFSEVWSGETLTDRDRRLLLLGLLVGDGMHDMIETQLDAALRTGVLTPDELREVVSFLTHYAGWTRASLLATRTEELIARFLGTPDH
ncbi:carboxymuconolactone decarboxylase family protein [Sphaerimonospora sp. CA-214678]|uniref:carboxymuconolactone decarboxylase family protein n=1 Tax=Sphaerimonospora sp. CA-214678 TaxID=3240029 RepID=UPI003D8F6C7F